MRLISISIAEANCSAALVLIGYGISTLSFIPLLLNKIKWIRDLAKILLLSSVFTDLVFLLLGNYPFSYPDAVNLFNNPQYASGTLTTFGASFLFALAGTALFFILIYTSLRTLSAGYSSKWSILFILIQVLAFICTKKVPGFYDFMPSVYRITGNALSAAIFDPESQWRRKEVSEQPVKRKVKHIILVVDESVTGTALSLNGFSIPTTPFLNANSSEFINFGIAASFTNYSAGSNLALLTGMRLDELPDTNYNSFEKPTLFQYARRAGYKTYFLDAQTSSDKLQNYTTAKDLPYIDSVFKPENVFPSITSWAKDSVLAQKIAQLTALEEPVFAYVNKAGAHWPYQTNFPADSIQNLLPHSISPEEDLTIDYYKSIYWNVDRFWKILYAKINVAESALVLYTSDHGENYPSSSFTTRHASVYEPDPKEGQVPLLAFDRSGFFKENYCPPKDGHSHQNIFPTLLTAMGYDTNFVNKYYGSGLQSMPERGQAWFQSGDLFGRGFNKRVYIQK